jgi:hypothetical protein
MEKLEFLYRNPDIRSEMGLSASASMEARTWETFGLQMENIFSMLLKRREMLPK